VIGRPPALRPESNIESEGNQPFVPQTKDEDNTFNDLLRRYGYGRDENDDNQRDSSRLQEKKNQNLSLHLSRSAPPLKGGGVIGEEDSDEDRGGIFHLTSPTKRDS
jgi:hypothetical protein